MLKQAIMEVQHSTTQNRGLMLTILSSLTWKVWGQLNQALICKIVALTN